VIGWLMRPVPLGRVAALRTLVYLFVVFDLFVYSSWVYNRAQVSSELYAPLRISRLLNLPAPTAVLVHVIFWALLATAILALTGRAPRLLGGVVFALYLGWMIIGMSYGKVDHDRFAFLVALAVLPTVGPARPGDRTRSEAAGWSMRVVQLAVVATYFLASWAKLRFGGIGWMTGSVLARAVIRRGSEFGELVAAVPGLLIAAQIGIVVFELLSPAIFLLRGRWRLAGVLFFLSFHLVTYAAVGISFAPHLIALTAFLPLERIRPVRWLADRVGRARGRPPSPSAGDGSPDALVGNRPAGP
jgi:hypothetical protein